NGAHNASQARGDFMFTGQFTSRGPGQGGGSPLADLLLGQTSSAQLSTVLGGDFRDRYVGLYVDDSWKIAPAVTVNAGLRYDLQTPIWEDQNRMTNFDLDPESPTYGTLVSARPGDLRARSFTNLDGLNLAPRIGGVLRLAPNTIIRAGYGVFYGGPGLFAPSTMGSANPPFFMRATFPSSLNATRSLLVLSDGFPPDVLDPRTPRHPDAIAIGSHNPLGRMQEWHLALERELPGQVDLSVTYLGTQSAHLRGLNNVNAPVPGPGPLDARRAFPQFGDILLTSDVVGASYQALQVRADRRVSRAFSLLAAYTWSHAFDNATDFSDTPT